MDERPPLRAAIGDHLWTLLDAGAREKGRAEENEGGGDHDLAPAVLALPITSSTPTTRSHRSGGRKERI
jgi:hypothetical protein